MSNLCSGALDHHRIEVETGHVEPVLVSQPDRQVARPAADFEHPSASGDHRRDIGGDGAVERTEQEPAQPVVGAGVANEDPTRHASAQGRAAVTHDGDGSGCRAQQERERSCTNHTDPPFSFPFRCSGKPAMLAPDAMRTRASITSCQR